MNTTEIVIRATDPDDAVAIGMAVRNGLGHFGFDNVSNSIVGAQEMGDPELVEWLAFYRIDPWGGYRADLGAAMVASTVANVHRASASQKQLHRASR